MKRLIMVVFASAIGLYSAFAVNASPVGVISISSMSGGGVTISATRFDFVLPTGAGFGDFATGTPTTFTWSGGVLTSATNPYGRILDVSVGSPTPISNFLQFYVNLTMPVPPGNGVLQAFPVFDLTSINPGGSAQGALNNCAGVTAIGVSCSPLVNTMGGPIVSPLVLTNRGTYTDVSFGVSLLGRDATGSIPWVGGFSTQFTGLTPDAIQATLNAGGSITNTYSGTFASTPNSTVPEPTSILLLSSGLGVIASWRRVKRR